MTKPPFDTPAQPWRSRFASLHPKAYLGMHAIGGGLATIALTWLFLAIADEIPEHSALARTDILVQGWIQTHGTEFGEKVFFLVSYLGASVLATMVTAVLLWFAWHRNWNRAIAVMLTTSGGLMLSALLKMIFHRGRPETATEFITRKSWSFPSGHSMNSVIAYGFLTVLLLEHVTGHRRRIGIVMVAAILIGAIGFSRVYLGVHYMSDVAGGWIAGAAWLIICAIGYHFTQDRSHAAPSQTKLSGD